MAGRLGSARCWGETGCPLEGPLAAGVVGESVLVRGGVAYDSVDCLKPALGSSSVKPVTCSGINQVALPSGSQHIVVSVCVKAVCVVRVVPLTTCLQTPFVNPYG